MTFPGLVESKINTIKNLDGFPDCTNVKKYFDELNSLRKLCNIDTDFDDLYRNYYDASHKKHLDNIYSSAYKVYSWAQEIMNKERLISVFPDENRALYSKSLIYLANLRDLNSFMREIDDNKFYTFKNLVRDYFNNLRIFCEHYCLLSSEASRFTKIQSSCDG
ncbi:MAG: hypothetical protein KR126chlam5_00046 [Candidatus Anoxychlamydiales bacterium]|nr:hypothetical protein [Candidatus Anoxychlamydiales bacterium]